MSSSPRIVVFKMREIIYTLLLLFLVVLLVVCLVLMFTKNRGRQNAAGEVQNQSATTGDLQNQSAAGNTQHPSAAAGETQTQTSRSDIQTLPTEAAQTTTDTTRSSTNAAQSGTSTAQSNTESTQSGTNTAVETASYAPGVYSTPITLGDSTVDVEVTVDSSHINSIRLVNLSEATAASFPLVSPSLEHIASQILATQSLEGITAPQENRYTAQMLLSAVADALELARAAAHEG